MIEKDATSNRTSLKTAGVGLKEWVYPLQTAVTFKSKMTTVMFSAEAVDVNFKDRWGGTALADAVREGHGQVAELLRDKGGELQYDEARASGGV